MTLDLARIELEGTNTEAQRLVDRAHTQATNTMREPQGPDPRHPPAGAHGPRVARCDRGARRPLAAPDPPHDGPARAAAESVETVAYFVLAEALANAAKHSEASAVDLSVHVHDHMLVLDVTDDGKGGARRAKWPRGPR